jgi:hypothetical protein
MLSSAKIAAYGVDVDENTSGNGKTAARGFSEKFGVDRQKRPRRKPAGALF